MNSYNIKQRLSELKKTSSELKAKVNQESQLSSANISSLLTSILPKERPQRSSYILEVDQIPKNLRNSNYMVPSQSSSILALMTSNIGSQLGDKTLWNSHTSDKKSVNSREPNENEVEKLQKQNQSLHQQISQVSNELKQLKRQQEKRLSQKWKQQVPFICRSQQLKVFITKLSIKQEDYDKIDYQTSEVELQCDNLHVKIGHKKSRTFLLVNLAQVKYIGSQVTCLELKGDDAINIFILFSSEQDRQEWDLALYVNHSIITSPFFDKTLFMPEQQSSFSHNQLKETTKSVSFTLPKKLDSSSNMSKTSSYEILYSKSPHLQLTLNGSPHEQSMLKGSNLSSHQSNHNELEVFGNGGQSHNDSNVFTSKFNMPESTLQAVNIYQSFMPQLQPKPEPINLISSQNLLLQQAKIQLKNGFYLTKYAKNGFSPHQKKVYLSYSEDYLLCSDTAGQKDLRKIPIENIMNIQQGIVGQGILKHINNPVKELYCVVQYISQGQNKVLQFGCSKSQYIKLFCKHLKQILFTKIKKTND